ncbi:AAA family ATPase (plasmid) [Deinococcus taeanensis]|uniref:ATP-binding protein n=1 Tax=Deinococcus taeanensis TaxID=2737050 RepID=UPI001CDB4861|nr:AAA family ATPase [Deinococcus taeanensis]UBV45103.1 AAA family ATPase [Deinococcus taeanensis]
MPFLRLLDQPHLDLDSGGRLELPVTRPALLLLYLACRGEWVSRSTLASLFHPETDESTARRNLRVLINRARALSWSRGVEVEQNRIRWLIPSDLQRFQAALREGDWAEALTWYKQPLLSDLGVKLSAELEDWLDLERHTLEAAWREAVMQRAKVLEEGRPDQAAELLSRLIDVDLLDEPAVQAAARAAYLAGRRSDGLVLLQRFTAEAERAGLTPLPETQALEGTLRQAEGDGAPLLAPVQQIPLVVRRPPRLIGRQLELARVRASSASLVLVAGEPGVGKSRLAAEIAPYAVKVSCREGLEGLPYHPVAEVLRAHLSDLPDLGSYRDDLARLLPELLDSPPPPPDPVTGKARLHEALTRALEHLGNGSPEAFPLLVEDLQWADPATLELLVHLVHRRRVRLLVTYRPHEVKEAIQEALSTLKTSTAVETLTLTPFTEADVHALLCDLGGEGGAQSASEWAAWLYRRAGGNAFFTLETLRALFEAGVLRVGSNGWRTLPEWGQRAAEIKVTGAVSELVRRRANRLTPGARKVLEVGSVLGDARHVPTLAAFTGLEEVNVEEALAEAEEAGMLRDGDFTHDLILQGLTTTLSAPRRRHIHAKALVVLQSAPPAVLARHALLAGKGSLAAQYGLAAAGEALRLFATRDAIHLYRTALEALTDGDRPDLRLALLEGLGDALVVAGEEWNAELCYGEGLPLAVMPEDRARLWRKTAQAQRQARQPAEAWAALAEARQVLGLLFPDRPAVWWHEHAERLLEETNLHYDAGEIEPLGRKLEAARAAVAAHPHPGLEARLWRAQMLYAHRRDRYRVDQNTLADAYRTLEAAQRAGDPHLEAETLFGLAFALLWHGTYDEAIRTAEACVRQAQQAEDKAKAVRALTYLAVAQRLAGHVRDVQRTATQALTLASGQGSRSYVEMAHGNLAWVACRQGNMDEAEQHCLRGLAVWGETPGLHPFAWVLRLPWTAILFQSGRLNEAVQQTFSLLHPACARLPDPLEAALQRTATQKTEETLVDALALAELHGYA